MFSLRIDLQEGFSGDTVIVTVDGSEVYRKSGVSTRLPVGVADSFEVQLDADQGRVSVDVATRGLTDATDIRPSKFPYLGVSLSGGRIAFEPSAELFRYL